MIEYFTVKRGMSKKDGAALSEAVQKWIRDNYNGERVRIKKGQRRSEYADQIKREFDGTNMGEITERYGVSRSTVYRCLSD